MNNVKFIKEIGKSKDNHIVWECQCSCGNIFQAQATKIRTKRIVRCKTCSLSVASEKLKKHGKRKSLEYLSWQAMKDRCLNEKSKDYKNYGAKGITIYEPWINSFELFYKYMGEKSKGESIDRIDNTKGYYPDNVRWATNSQQQRNKSNSLWIDWKGVKTHISDIAKELGITKGAAHLRFKRGKLYE